MEKEQILGKLLVESKYWSWLPGMLLITPKENKKRVIKINKNNSLVYLFSEEEDGMGGWFSAKDCYPDIHDVATLGCIFSLLKFRMKEPTLHLTPDEGGWYINKLSLDGPEWYCGESSWGLENCGSPILFDSQQEAIIFTFINLDKDTIH